LKKQQIRLIVILRQLGSIFTILVVVIPDMRTFGLVFFLAFKRVIFKIRYAFFELLE